MSTSDPQPVAQLAAPSLRVRISGFILTVQVILFATHWFVYQTWTFFRPETDAFRKALQITLMVLSVSFVCASLLAFRYWNPWVRAFYRAAAIWLGFLNFFFLAACVSWAAFLASRLFGLAIPGANIALIAFGLAVLGGSYGLANARWIRIKKITVTLPNLPASWRGRVAALLTDVHLGHVNGAGFLRRIVSKLQSLNPDVVFLAGDLYDGTSVDAAGVAASWRQLSPPLGTHFVTGNHEEFSDRRKYLRAVSQAGMNVLNNERVVLDNLQIIGVHDREASDPAHFRAILESARIDRTTASILLTHVPRALSIPEEAGISLELCGHTHAGQIFPFTWFTRRIFGHYTYGLNRFASLQVYTSFGAGTWGPPMRVATHPEIVLIQFV